MEQMNGDPEPLLAVALAAIVFAAMRLVVTRWRR
jgi:hypothetical protein